MNYDQPTSCGGAQLYDTDPAQNGSCPPATWQPVAVPNYERMSEREAVWRYPNAAFLPWLVALLLESLAGIWMPLSLTLWRSHDDDASPEMAPWPVPVYSPRNSTAPHLGAAE